MINITKRPLSIILTTIVMFAFQATVARASLADVTLEDMQTIIRTIGFLENKPAGESVISIIYDPNNSASLQDAKQMEKFLNNGKKNIKPHMVPLSRLNDLENSAFAYVTTGIYEHHDAFGNALKKYKVLSFTQERKCVDDGHCAVYIKSKGRVEIVVNKTAMEIVHAEFKPLFLMMVTVI